MHGLTYILKSTISLIMDDGSDCRCDNNNSHVTKASTSMRKHQRTITHKIRKTASESKKM